MTKRREVGFWGAENPLKVPARDFGEQRIGANVVGLGLGERKKLSNVVRLDSWDKKIPPMSSGSFFGSRNLGLGTFAGFLCDAEAGQTTQWQFRLLRGCAGHITN